MNTNYLSISEKMALSREDFEFFLYNVFIMGGYLDSIPNDDKYSFKPILKHMKDYPDWMIIYQDRMRQSFGTTFIFAYAIHQALFNTNKKETVFVSANKNSNQNNIKKFIECLFTMSIESRIYKEDYRSSNTTILLSNNSKITFICYDYKNPINFECYFVRGLTPDLLIPLDAPYTMGYEKIRESLIPILRKNNGKELIISNGYNMHGNIYPVSYFFRLKNDIIEGHIFMEKAYYSRHNALDANFNEEELQHAFKLMNNEPTTFYREFLCGATFGFSKFDDYNLTYDSLPECLKPLAKPFKGE